MIPDALTVPSAAPERSAVSVLAGRGLEGLALVLVLATGMPWDPLVVHESWYEPQLHLARVLGVQWGIDIAATYGPWGFVGLALYHPETFHWMLLLNGAVLALTALRVGAFVARVLPNAPWARGPFMAACLLPLTPVVVDEWTPLLFCPHVWAVCVVLEWLTGRTPARPWLDAVSAAALGFFALVKLSVWPIALMAVVASWLQPGRRRWVFTAALAGAALVAWLAAGQSPFHLAAFVRTGLGAIGGFKNEMTRWEAELSAGVLLVGAVLGVMALLAWLYRPRTPRAVVGFLALGAVFGQILQSALVRADLGHYVPNVMAVLSLLPLLFAAAWASGTWRGRCGAIGMVACGAVLFDLSPGTPDYPRSAREARAFLRFLDDGAALLQARREKWFSGLRTTHPLDAMALTGRGGIVGGDPAILESHSVPFTLQPSITSYSAYHPVLQDLNSDWIEAPERLAWLLWCTPKAVEIHYPSESDGRSYVALLTHFRFVRDVGGCALLARTPPRPIVARSPERRMIRVGQTLALESEPGGLVWAEIRVQETPLGGLIRRLFKPTPLNFQVWFRNGRTLTHELMPPMASQGFLLSPYPARWQALESAATGVATEKSVSAFRILEWRQGPVSSDLFYEPELQVTLTSLSGVRP